MRRLSKHDWAWWVSLRLLATALILPFGWSLPFPRLAPVRVPAHRGR